MKINITTHGLLDKIKGVLDQIYDPEIPISILQLGLIYAIEEPSPGKITIDMTFTSPGCPSIQEIPDEIISSLYTIDGVNGVLITTTWSPPWHTGMITPEGRAYLGI